MPRVLAGCCVPLLGVGPSRRDLLNLSLGAWTRTPPRFSGALARFFPDNIGLTSVYTGSARWNLHHHSNFSDGHRFRGCSHSLMFRLPYLLGLQVAPTSIAPVALQILPVIRFVVSSTSRSANLKHRPRAARPFTPRNGRVVTLHELWYRYIPESSNWYDGTFTR